MSFPEFGVRPVATDGAICIGERRNEDARDVLCPNYMLILMYIV